MKVMTLNLHSYQEDHQDEKFKCIAKKIVDKKIDVICFSEASQRLTTPHISKYIREDNALKIICDYINELSDETYQYAWELSHYGFTIYEEGIGVITRLPIKEVQSRYVSAETDLFNYKSRKVLKVCVEYDNEEINIFSVHLGMDDELEPFDLQFKKLDKWVKEQNGKCIMAGSFNSDVLSDGYNQIISAQYTDQYIQALPEGFDDYTFINPSGYEFRNSKDIRIDYIFTLNQPFTATEADRFFDKEERVSDHVAVYVDLKAV